MHVRRCDIDTGGAIWLYNPAQHKTAWRGKTRTIAIGPKEPQELLKGFFTPELGAVLVFPGSCGVEELRAGAAPAKRTTPRYPSHMRRNAAKWKAKPRRAASEKYNRGSYEVAIDRACDRAFAPCQANWLKRENETASAWWKRLTKEQRAEVKTWRKAHRWSPNQLRHAVATRVRKDYGLEAAQVLLGHSRADVTQVYAERNEALAAEVAAKLG